MADIFKKLLKQKYNANTLKKNKLTYHPSLLEIIFGKKNCDLYHILEI